jgi:PhzF family phenazine biosynthesis protein
VRFFTPVEEVDLCGHATIAVFSLLAGQQKIQFGEYTQETKAGILKVEYRPDRTIFMNQSIPKFYEVIDKSEISDSLNINESKIAGKLPAQIVSTGLRDILIPINDLETLLSIQPDFEAIKDISKRYNVTGYHVFTMETKYNSTAHCRNFAPLYDIPEESATGTSNGALSCYLYKYGVISENECSKLVFEQGYSMDKPSEILAGLCIENKSIKEVKVGGNALKIEEKEYELDKDVDIPVFGGK